MVYTANISIVAVIPIITIPDTDKSYIYRMLLIATTRVINLFDRESKFSEKGVVMKIEKRNWQSKNKWWSVSTLLITVVSFAILAMVLSGCTLINKLFNKESTELFRVVSKEGSGIMDCSGNWIVEPEKPQIRTISGSMVDGLAPVIVLSDSQYETYINKKGEFAFEENYERAMPFSEGLAAVLVDGKWGFINTKGSMVIEPQYLSSQIGSFHNGMANVAIEVNENFNFPQKWIFINQDGEKVLGPYESANSFSEGYAAVTEIDENDNWISGFIDPKGEYVLHFTEEDRLSAVGLYSDGFFPVLDQDMIIREGVCSIGFMDKSGEWVIEPQYCSVGAFKNGLTPASTTKSSIGIMEYGYINTSGEIVIEEQYSSASSFSGDCALVLWDNFNGIGLIDQTGELIYQYEH